MKSGGVFIGEMSFSSTLRARFIIINNNTKERRCKTIVENRCKFPYRHWKISSAFIFVSLNFVFVIIFIHYSPSSSRTCSHRSNEEIHHAKTRTCFLLMVIFVVLCCRCIEFRRIMPLLVKMLRIVANVPKLRCSSRLTTEIAHKHSPTFLHYEIK